MCCDRVITSYPNFSIGVSGGFVTVTAGEETTKLSTPEAEFLAEEFMDVVRAAGCKCILAASEAPKKDEECSTDNKYEMFGEPNERGLRRVRALKDFGAVKARDIGGWIEKEENLSQDGNCWVSGKARVYGDTRVYGNACVFGDAQVFGNARVSGEAQVYGKGLVFGDARVYGKARVSGEARVYGDAWISEDAWVYGDAHVSGEAQVFGKGRVYGDAWVSEDAWVYGDAEVSSGERK